MTSESESESNLFSNWFQNQVKNQKGGYLHLWLGLSLGNLHFLLKLAFDCDSGPLDGGR